MEVDEAQRNLLGTKLSCKVAKINTKYFHTLATIRRSRNSIKSLISNDTIIDDPMQIKKETIVFFQKIFREEHYTRPTFEGLYFKKLFTGHSTMLIAPFSQKEIDEAVTSCDGEKAPGPYGFTFNFIKAAWEVLKDDVYSIVNEFWASSWLQKGSNNAFIVLIPKLSHP